MENNKIIKYIPWLLLVVCVAYIFIQSAKNRYVFVDQDGDTFPVTNERNQTVDCNDSDPSVNPESIDIPDDGVDQDCRDGDFKLYTDPDQSRVDKNVVLFKNFIFSGYVNQNTIVNNSRLIKVKGKIKSAKLIVKASTTDFGYDPTRKHTVYFYIDNGLQGGHIGTTKTDGKIAGGDFFTKQTSPFEKEYSLEELPISQQTNGQRILNVINILNSGENHYIGAFVSTGIFGMLNEFSIQYTCDRSTDCEISILE